MRGGLQTAKPAVRRPLDGRVRHRMRAHRLGLGLQAQHCVRRLRASATTYTGHCAKTSRRMTKTLGCTATEQTVHVPPNPFVLERARDYRLDQENSSVR